MTAASFHLLLAGTLSMAACAALDTEIGDDTEMWNEDSVAEPVERVASDESEMPSWSHIDAVSAASEPPELFVEIVSPMNGDSVAAGSQLTAFGGPGWAIPALELHVDGTETASMTGYNVTFEIDKATTEGSHTFRAEFTCVLDSCAGQTASASVTLDITPAVDDPDDPTDPSNPDDPTDPSVPDDDIDGPDSPDGSGDDPNTGFQSVGCTASNSSSDSLCFAFLLGFLTVLRRRPKIA